MSSYSVNLPPPTGSGYSDMSVNETAGSDVVTVKLKKDDGSIMTYTIDPNKPPVNSQGNPSGADDPSLFPIDLIPNFMQAMSALTVQMALGKTQSDNNQLADQIIDNGTTGGEVGGTGGTPGAAGAQNVQAVDQSNGWFNISFLAVLFAIMNEVSTILMGVDVKQGLLGIQYLQMVVAMAKDVQQLYIEAGEKEAQQLETQGWSMIACGIIQIGQGAFTVGMYAKQASSQGDKETQKANKKVNETEENLNKAKQADAKAALNLQQAKESASEFKSSPEKDTPTGRDNIEQSQRKLDAAQAAKAKTQSNLDTATKDHQEALQKRDIAKKIFEEKKTARISMTSQAINQLGGGLASLAQGTGKLIEADIARDKAILQAQAKCEEIIQQIFNNQWNNFQENQKKMHDFINEFISSFQQILQSNYQSQRVSH